MKRIVWLAGLFVFLAVSASSMKPQAAAPEGPSPTAYATDQAPRAALLPAPRSDAAYGKIPLQFIPNEGQLDGAVAFTIQGRDKTVHFTSEGLTFTLNGSRQAEPADTPDHAASPSWVVKLDFLDANPDAVPVSIEESGAVISYFKGAPGDWKTGLRASSKIAYRELWPGIDLVYHGTVDRLKYEFIVHPGADPSRIRLAYRGADSVTLTEEGRLEIQTPAAGFSDDIPVAWQEVDGRTVEIAMAYKLLDAPPSRNGIDPTNRKGSGGTTRALQDGPDRIPHAYGFEVGEYDRSRPLVLDPAVLVYCGFIGGSNSEFGFGIAVDSAGSAYITGHTSSTEDDFPVTVGPYLIHGGSTDAFVAKIDASGAALVYCGYIGGSGGDAGLGIAVDGSGNAFVTGYTSSTEASFPVTVGPGLSYGGGTHDAFVAKVDASGTSLVYCGYVGGSGYEQGNGVAVDGSGNAYITGHTDSTQATFPVTVGPRLIHGGVADAFVAKINVSGASLVYCGYIGGSGLDRGNGIAVDGSGNAYVTGNTFSTQVTFPVTVGPHLIYGGSLDAFAAKVDASGASLAYCGYIGGSGYDYGLGIAVDSEGSAYVAGSTYSTEVTFPVTVGPHLIHGGGEVDAYVAKIDPSGTPLLYCGYIGGSEPDYASGVAVDSAGNAYITGYTESTEASFPVIGGPALAYNEAGDAFVAKIEASGTSLVYCGYIGGSFFDQGTGIAVDSAGNAYVTGHTASTEASFPVTVGPGLSYGGGTRDVFAAKISYADLPTLTSLLPAGAKAGDPAFVLTATGSEFVDGAVVMWDGHGRPTTFVNSFQLSAEIGAADVATGKIVQVTIANPPPVGGASEAVAFPVTTFTLGSSPASATVRAGQSAVYTIQVTPQFGSFDSSIAFSCTGLPAATTASFSPASVTPGGGAATSTLTLTTRARQNLEAGAAVGSTGGGPSVPGPPRFFTLGLLLLLFSALLLWLRSSKPGPAKLARRWLAACAVICLVVALSSCSAGGGGPTPSTGTPAGTYQVTVQGASGGLTVSTTVTLVVN